MNPPGVSRRPARGARTLLLAAIAALAVLSAPAPAVAQEKIQPGASIINEDGGQCTLNWVYDGAGGQAAGVFVGTAAHCVERVGEEIRLQTGTFGQSVLTIGEVGFISSRLDYALIRVAPENLSLVDPAMKGHPSFPTGVSTTQTSSLGDLIRFSGNGVGFHATALTQEQRAGVLHFHDEEEWSALGPVSPGDSGGPAGNISDGNRALGIVTVLCVGTTCAGAGGVSVEGLLADAAASGFPVQLRTV